MGIPAAARERLLRVLHFLEAPAFRTDGPGLGKTISSAGLEALTGWPRDTIRKDISFLAGFPENSPENPGPANEGERRFHSGDPRRANEGERRSPPGNGEEDRTMGTSAGYTPETLGPAIRRALGLDRRRKFCVVGLGRLGSAYLNAGTGMDSLDYGEFEPAAGFDTNVNRVEILKSPVPLFPAYKMAEVINRFGIEIALLCVPAEAAQGAAEKCAGAGIRGIVNFAPVALKPPGDVAVRYVYITDELRALAVTMR